MIGPGDGFRALFDRATDLVVLVDVSGNVLDANPAALRAKGGRSLVVEVQGSLVRQDGQPDAVLAIGRDTDVTSLRRA